MIVPVTGAPIENEIRRFLRRVRVARFLGALCEGLVFVALALAAVLLVLRTFDVALEPSPWWGLFALPALGWAVFTVRQLPFGRTASAAHLDRRLGLDGLLLTAIERDTAGYNGTLRARLQAARDALPRVRYRVLGARLGLAAAVVLVLLFLPAPEPRGAEANPLVADTLADYQEKLDALEEEEGLREEVHEELTERLDELKKKLDENGNVEWKDLDALEDALEHQQALEASRLARSREDLAAFARGEDESIEGGLEVAASRMAELLRDAEMAGLLDKLPEGLKQKLGAGASNAAGLDGLKGLDEQALKQLAAALAQSADDKLAGLSAEGLDALGELGTLDELITDEMLAQLGDPCGLCDGGEGDCPG